MNFSEALAALRRNAVVIVVMLALTAAATAFVWQRVPVTYQSQATMIVLLPKQSLNDTPDPAPVNPYLGVGALSTQVAASALANVAGSDDFLAALSDAGVRSTTTVAVAGYGGGVILELTAVDPVATTASGDLTLLARQLSDELEQRQRDAGAPAGTLITVTDLTSPSAGTPLTGDRTKLAAVAAVIGLVVSAAVVVLNEGRLRRRRMRRAVAEVSATAGSVPTAETLPHDDERAVARPVLPRPTTGAGVSVRTGERASGVSVPQG